MFRDIYCVLDNIISNIGYFKDILVQFMDVLRDFWAVFKEFCL